MSHSLGWIGVDLDGTLAEYYGWVSDTHIGGPIPAMAERVRNWLAAGQEVRIFTARVSARDVGHVARMVKIIQDWTEEHFAQRLVVTCAKDYSMIQLWDDRCVQVEANTGRRMDGTEG